MPVPIERNDEVVDASGNPLPLLTERGEVDVVLERHRQLERARPRARPEGDALEPRDARGEVDTAVSASTTPGTPTTTPSIDGRRQPGRIAPVVAKRRDRRRARFGVAAGAPRRPGARGSRRADRRSRRAGNAHRDRSPSTSAASGTGSKKTRPVARPVRGLRPPRGRARRRAATGSRATRSASRYPTIREISARETGADARIVSSTVRSFRSLSSGGIAAAEGWSIRAIS